MFTIKANFAIKHKSTGGGWSIHWTVQNIAFICALPVVEVKLVESTKNLVSMSPLVLCYVVNSD